MSQKRQEMRELLPEIRNKSFDEVCLGFDDGTAVIEAARCLNCKKPGCVEGCPVGMDIPRFIELIKSGHTAEAYYDIIKRNYLPGVCGRVCPQSEQCERLCVRNNERMGGAVSIGGLERYAADFAVKNKLKLTPNIIKNGKKIAVAGSGPAGLTAAAELAAAGCEVTVFEAFHEFGGVLVYGIPQFRLPKELVNGEIQKLRDLGVKFQKNIVIGKTLTFENLLGEFDAVFVGIGAGLPIFLNIKGENLNGVYSANEFLTRVNLMRAYKKDSDTPIFVGKKIAVAGAGNVAMDAARTALRCGAKSVEIVYRRTREEMPARSDEIKHAAEEGVSFRFLTVPVEIIGQDGRVVGMKCRMMRLGERDERGRRSPVEIDGSDFFESYDQVIVALGTSPNPILKSSTDIIKFSGRGGITVDEKFTTSHPKIFAAGDAVSGAATVILAMGNAKSAAKNIMQSLAITEETNSITFPTKSGIQRQINF